jgi:hypothetical protein
MKETTVHLTEEELAYVKAHGSNFLRHLLQARMALDNLLPFIEGMEEPWPLTPST